MKPVRIALVGFGRIARDWLRVLVELDGFEVAGVVDPDQRARARAGVRAFASVGELLEAEHPDAAIVATPPSTHAELAIALLGAGCDVFCEKPLALTSRDAERMLATARDARRTLMMASKFRFVPDVDAARRLIADGAIGTPILYRNVFCSFVPMAGRWNSDAAIAGGGVVFDNGAHAVDLARCLLGPLARVLAVVGPRAQPVEVEDSARLLFETRAHRTPGIADLSWSVDGGDDDYVEIDGSEGIVQLGWHRSRWRPRGSSDWRVLGPGYDKLAAFRAQLVHFRDVTARRAEPTITDVDAIASVRFLEAAYRSIERGGWVETGDPAP